jgi:hypothetical protein
MRLLAFLSSVLLLGGTALSQDITISKDSLWVCNSMTLSRDDEIALKNTSSDTMRLDSAFIEFEVLDTSGFMMTIANDRLQMLFTEGHAADSLAGPIKYLSLIHLGNNVFRLNNTYAGPTILPPFSILPTGDNLKIHRAQIGSCFDCNSLPRYPKYLKGKLLLFYNNHQKITIKLYSNDLRPIAVQLIGPHTELVTPSLARNSFLLDGRKITVTTIQKISKQSLHSVYRLTLEQKD